MQKVLIIYAIIQLMTTAYGLAVIESIRPMVEKKLKEQGYVKNSDSISNINYTITNVLKALIPFYYLVKSLSILSDKGSVDKEVNREIKSNHYVVKENTETVDDNIYDTEDYSDSIFRGPYDYQFEEPDRYEARQNDLSAYDHEETPTDYIQRVSKPEDNLTLTPFDNKDKVVEHVVVNGSVTKEDIARAICELSDHELETLGNKIQELSLIRRNKRLKLEKDVA